MNIIQQIREEAPRGGSGDRFPAKQLLPLIDALDAAMAEIAHRRTPAWLYDPEWRDKAKMLATATDSAMERLK